MRRAASQRGSRAGFSLVEMLAVLAVVGIAASVVASGLSRPGPSSALEADARKLAAALRLTRVAAMAQGLDFVVAFEPNAGRYVSPVTGAVVLDAHTELALAGPAGRNIRFFASGHSSGGTILLRREGAERRLHVSWVTGNVHLGR